MSGSLGQPKDPVFTPRSDTGVEIRPTDSEYKIIEHVAPKLIPESKGVVSLYTESEPCPACDSVIKQFEEEFPGAKLNVTYRFPRP